MLHVTRQDLILVRTLILFYCKKSVKELLLKANQPNPKFFQITLDLLATLFLTLYMPVCTVTVSDKEGAL